MKHVKHINEYNYDESKYQVWELISFKNQETGEIVNEVSENEIPKDHNMNNNSKYSIHSVKRITDNEIFTIGDTVGFIGIEHSFGQITWMWINNIQLRIDIGKGGFPLTDDMIKM